MVSVVESNGIVNKMSNKIVFYLDTNIFVFCYHPTRQHEEDILPFLEAASKSGFIDLVTSDFTFTEFTKVLIQNGIETNKIIQYVSDLTRRKKIGKKYKFDIVSVNGKFKNYAFEDFFVDLQKIFRSSKLSISDAIHSLIMQNNGLKYIVSTDADFSKDQKLCSIKPNLLYPYIKTITKLSEEIFDSEMVSKNIETETKALEMIIKALELEYTRKSKNVTSISAAAICLSADLTKHPVAQELKGFVEVPESAIKSRYDELTREIKKRNLLQSRKKLLKVLDPDDKLLIYEIMD